MSTYLLVLLLSYPDLSTDVYYNTGRSFNDLSECEAAAVEALKDPHWRPDVDALCMEVIGG